MAESPISPSTITPDPVLLSLTENPDEITVEAANELLTLADDNLNFRPHELREQGISGRDFATDPVVRVDRLPHSPPPPNGPNLDQEARNMSSSDSDARMLRVPRRARFLLPSDSSSVASTPVVLHVNGDGRVWPRREERVNGENGHVTPPQQGPQEVRANGENGHAPSHRRPQPARTNGQQSHAPPQPRQGPVRRPSASVPRGVLEPTATSLASEPPLLDMTAAQRNTQRLLLLNDLRNASVFINQRVRIRFAPPTPDTLVIQERFYSRQRAMQRDRSYSYSPLETEQLATQMSRVTQPRRSPSSQFTSGGQTLWIRGRWRTPRQQQRLRFEIDSREFDFRMRRRAGESPQQIRNRHEREESVSHAADLTRRLSAEFDRMNLPSDPPSAVEGRSEVSSMPSSPPVVNEHFAPVSNRRNTLPVERHTILNGESLPFVPGRTLVPVIANGRTSEQRRLHPLPDCGEWRPAIDGNPAGPRQARPSCPREGEAGPSTWAQAEAHDELESAHPAPEKGEAEPSNGVPTETNEQGDCVPPTSALPKHCEVGPSNDVQPQPNGREASASPTPKSPEDCATRSSSPAEEIPREASPTPPLPAPWNPFHGGVILGRLGTGPIRFVTPMAVYVPGNPNTPAAPPPTAQRERRRDENVRFTEIGSSENEEGSERVIASSSSQASESDKNLDADDEDSDGDPVIETSWLYGK